MGSQPPTALMTSPCRSDHRRADCCVHRRTTPQYRHCTLSCSMPIRQGFALCSVLVVAALIPDHLLCPHALTPTQRMLQQMGINANLGPFNIVVRNAGFSFAKQVRGTRQQTRSFFQDQVFPTAFLCMSCFTVRQQGIPLRSYPLRSGGAASDTVSSGRPVPRAGHCACRWRPHPCGPPHRCRHGVPVYAVQVERLGDHGRTVDIRTCYGSAGKLGRALVSFLSNAWGRLLATCTHGTARTRACASVNKSRRC